MLKLLHLQCALQERYPVSEEFDAMQAFFDKYGTVAHIERRIPMYNSVKVGTVRE